MSGTEATLVERYTLVAYEHSDRLDPKSDGEWVRYADHTARIEALEADNARLAKERDTLRGYEDCCRGAAPERLCACENYPNWKARAEAAEAQLVRGEPVASSVKELLTRIESKSAALRVGGPDPIDLMGLSDALEEAIDLATDAIRILASPPPAAPQERPTGHVEIAHDGFTGDIIGHYTTREGKRGVVVQQDNTRVVHVYGEKWLPIQFEDQSEDGVTPEDIKEWKSRLPSVTAGLAGVFGDAIASGPPAAPQGWRLVPVEPTDKMMVAGGFSFAGTCPNNLVFPKVRKVWDDMLAAAPIPAPGREP